MILKYVGYTMNCSVRWGSVSTPIDLQGAYFTMAVCRSSPLFRISWHIPTVLKYGIVSSLDNIYRWGNGVRIQ